MLSKYIVLVLVILLFTVVVDVRGDVNDTVAATLDISFIDYTFSEMKAQRGVYANALTPIAAKVVPGAYVRLEKYYDVYGLTLGTSVTIVTTVHVPSNTDFALFPKLVHELSDAVSNNFGLQKLGMSTVREVFVHKVLPKPKALSIGWFALFAVTGVDIMVIATICMNRSRSQQSAKRRMDAQSMEMQTANSAAQQETGIIQRTDVCFTYEDEMQKLREALESEVDKERDDGELQESTNLSLWLQSSPEFMLPKSREAVIAQRKSERLQEEPASSLLFTKTGSARHVDVGTFQSMLDTDMKLPPRRNDRNK